MPSAADRRVFWLAAVAVVVADLASKLAAEAALALREAVPVVGDAVQLRLVYNPGAAFGLHLGPWSRWIFLAVAVGAIIILDRMSRTASPGDRLRQLACGLVAGGAFGNLVDRVRSAQGVVDFLDVGIGLHRWPTFNVADIGVSLGAIALAWSLWLEDDRREAAQRAALPPTDPGPSA
ncbi:MAG TPA: signal peptidase II [Gemmatimonadales bacterium]|jgi:signal peptidase II|nr:signal peptidase II [Gemmatimonadales bacterium]